MAEVEPIVEPDSVGDDIWRESMSFICVHEPILPIPASLFGSTHRHLPPTTPGQPFPLKKNQPDNQEKKR